MKFAYSTDIGKRSANEDCLYVPQSEDAKPLFLVADGMGGHKAGAIASRMAAETVADYIQNYDSFDLETMVKVASAYANAQVYKEAMSNKTLSGMGTTLTFVYIAGNRYVAANVGDSRIYHFNGVSLNQITKDHSYVAALLLAGEITAEEANRHPNRNIITRAIGIQPKEQADVFENEWRVDDILLLCTDGLCRGLSDAEIKKVLKNTYDLDDACAQLTYLARKNGASDNITIILVKNEGETAQ